MAIVARPDRPPAGNRVSPGEKEESEPQTQPRPSASFEGPPLPSARKRRRAREGTMEMPAPDELLDVLQPSSDPGKTGTVMMDVTPDSDGDTQKQARKNLPGKGGTVAIPMIPDATPTASKGQRGTMKMAEIDPTSSRLRASTLKSETTAAEIAELRRRYGSALQQPTNATIASSGTETPRPRANSGPVSVGVEEAKPDDEARDSKRERANTVEIAVVRPSDAVNEVSPLSDTHPPPAPDDEAVDSNEDDDDGITANLIQPDELKAALRQTPPPSDLGRADRGEVAAPEGTLDADRATGVEDEEASEPTTEGAVAAPLGAGMALGAPSTQTATRFETQTELDDDDDHTEPRDGGPPSRVEADRLDAWLDALDGPDGQEASPAEGADGSEPSEEDEVIADTEPPPAPAESAKPPSAVSPEEVVGSLDVAAVLASLSRPGTPRGGTPAPPESASPATATGPPEPIGMAPAEKSAARTVSSQRGPRAPAMTQSFAVPPSEKALPFAPSSSAAKVDPISGDPPSARGDAPMAADQLEDWLRSHLDDRIDAPAGPAPPLPTAASPAHANIAAMPPAVVTSAPALATDFAPHAIAPNPIAEAGAPPKPRDADPPPATATRASSHAPTLPIAAYAKVKVAIWDQGLDLMEAIAREDIEEPVWRDNEVRMADALAKEAREGEATLANSVRREIRALRDTITEEANGMDIESYAEARIAVEKANKVGEALELALARLGLTPEAWEEARADWTKRARRDPSLARKIRREVARSRREAKAEAAEAPSSARAG